MRVLIDNKWIDGYLDYYRAQAQCRIQVLAWQNLEKLEDVYLIPSRSLRLVWNYLRECGLLAVWRKIMSRQAERYRNEKFVSCGMGRIIEPADDSFRTGQGVVFIAPCHPRCVERIVLPKELIGLIGDELLPQNPIQYISQKIIADQWWKPIRGWNSYSGNLLEAELCKKLIGKAIQTLCDFSEFASFLPTNINASVMEIAEKREEYRNRGRSAVLFGFGNYAKSNILPNVGKYFDIDCIHEVDPVQMRQNASYRWDTCPDLRPLEKYDVYFIAGFHHTHAPLAIEALRSNACVVLEKPIAVDEEQHMALLKAMTESSGKLFVGFHKRYMIINQYAIRDLKMQPNKPISYHCIVFEIPLPGLHWYRWPNSKSRLISNGCHWIDHFLYLNDYCEVKSAHVTISTGGAINCSVELHNNAFFTMLLTDVGSTRIGVQDYVELRSDDITAKIINGSIYIAENKNRIMRKRVINKTYAYSRMYRQIVRRIVGNEPGDSLRSVRISSGLVLELEMKFRAALDKQPESKAF